MRQVSTDKMLLTLVPFGHRALATHRGEQIEKRAIRFGGYATLHLNNFGNRR